MTKSIIGENEYWKIYNKMNDSIENWIDNHLGNYAYWNSVITYQLDSVLCINKEKNIIITTILLPYVGSNGRSDDVVYFYGIKLESQWYFFCGSTMVLLREYYKKDIDIPLTFEKIRQIATYNIYRGYLKNGKNGQLEINDNFFSHFYERDAYNYPFTTQEAWEESWLKLCRENWKKKEKPLVKQNE